MNVKEVRFAADRKKSPRWRLGVRGGGGGDEGVIPHGAGGGFGVFLEAVEQDAAGGGINDPEFLHAGAGVNFALGAEVEAGGLGGEDFDDQVGGALGPLAAEDGLVLVQDEDQVGLEDVDVGELDVERGDVDGADRAAFQVAVEEADEIVKNVLVITVGGRGPVEFSFNQLEARAVLGRFPVIVPGEEAGRGGEHEPA